MQTGYLLLNGNAPISTITILIDNAERKISVIVKVLHNKKIPVLFLRYLRIIKTGIYFIF